MHSITVSTTIDRPREEVFDHLDDLAAHKAFTDHFLVDWTITSPRSTGVAASAAAGGSPPPRERGIAHRARLCAWP